MSDYSEFGKWFKRAAREETSPEEVTQYTQWEIISRGRPRYQVLMFYCSSCSGTVGYAKWTRIVKVKEKRYKVVKKYYDEEKRTSEMRYRELISKKETRAYKWFAGRNIETGDIWCSNNPWTGKTHCGAL